MQTDNHTVRGDFLVAAFNDAWVRALKNEFINNNNVARAPAELMEAVLISLKEVSNGDPAIVGMSAFAKWCSQASTKLDPASPGPGERLH